LASPDEETRRRAVERALSLPPAESAHHLIEALGDASWRVRKTAVERLVSSNESERVIELLISALADGENPGRRNAAVEALVGLGPIVVPKLLDGLKCEDVDVRKLAVDALAALGHESARQALISTLDDSDPNVRAAACDALAVIGGNGVAAELEQRACEEREDQLVRFSALQALVHLDVRLQAAALRPALRDPILRPPAYALLGNSADAEAGDYLLEGLESSSPAAREAAIRALLRMIAREDGRDADAIV
jgi:HEAT repeat protein